MLIKAQDLKVGQSIVMYGRAEEISEVQIEAGVVIATLASQQNNPFISSRFASYSVDSVIEVL